VCGTGAGVVGDVFVGEGVDLVGVEGQRVWLSEREVPCRDCYSFEYYIKQIDSPSSQDNRLS
jgi:hypothetical protein